MNCIRRKQTAELKEDSPVKKEAEESFEEAQDQEEEEQMPEIEVNTLSPLFQTQIQSYKRDHFRSLPTIHHEFVYSCLHPIEEDFVLCLEKNVYPNHLQIETLYEMTKLPSGEEVPLLWEPDENESKQATARKQKGKEAFSQKLAENIIKQTLNTGGNDEGCESKEVTQGNEGEGTQTAAQQKKGEDDGSAKRLFEFYEPRTFQNFKELSDEKKHKYAISCWKLNEGRQAIQYKEYGFDGRCAGNKFFVSQNGKSVFFFLSVLNQEREAQVVQVVRLDSMTLEVEQILDLPPDMPQLLTQNFQDASLMHSDVDYLFLGDSSSNSTYIIEMESGVLVQKIDSMVRTKQESKLDVNEGGGLISLLGKHSLLKSNLNFVVRKVLFKDTGTATSGKNYFYILANRESDTSSLLLFKVKIGEEHLEASFKQAPLLKIDNIDLNQLESIHANKSLDQFVFLMKNKAFLINKPLSKKQREKGVTPSPKNGVHVVQKHSFLYDDLIMYKIEEDESVHVFFLSDLKRTYPPHQVTHEKNQHMDVRRTKDAKRLIFVGKPNVPVPNIMVNVIVNYNMDAENQDVRIAQIQEISEYKCCYPHVFFCKGNSELFVQSLNFKNKMLKLDLEEEFLCFVDITPHFQFKHDVDEENPKSPSGGQGPPLRTDRESIQGSQVKGGPKSARLPLGFKQLIVNSHIAFLTQDDNDNLYLQILEYDPYTYEKEFKLFASKKALMNKEEIKSSVIRAVLMRSYISKNFQDYQLVLQLRDSLIVKSLFNSSAPNPLESLRSFSTPMLFYPYCEAKKKKNPRVPIQQMKNDSLFFISKDYMRAKIVRLTFNVRGKDPYKVYYENRSQQIHLFAQQDRRILFMDEGLMVKVLKIDEKNEKLNDNDMLDMPLMVKEQWKKSENESIQISEQTLYVKNQIIFTNSLENISKDYSFYGKQDMFNCKTLRGGPKRIEYTSFMMYIVAGLSRDYLGESAPLQVPQYIDKQVDAKKEAQMQRSEQVKKKKEEDKTRESQLDADSKQSLQRKKTLRESIHSPLIDQLQSARTAGGNLIYADEEVSESNVEILFTPLAEQRNITLVYDRDEPKVAPYTFQMVERSTFIDRFHNILAVVGKKYCVFSKNGDFLGQVKFVKGEFKPSAFNNNEGPNQQEEKPIDVEQREIYRKEQERFMQEEQKDELQTVFVHEINPILRSSNVSNRSGNKSVTNRSPENRRPEEAKEESQAFDFGSAYTPGPLEHENALLQRDGHESELKDSSRAQNSPLGQSRKGLLASKIKLAVKKLRQQNKFLIGINKEKDSKNFKDQYYSSDDMYLLWLTDVVPEQLDPSKGPIKHTCYFLFFAAEDKRQHLDNESHELALYRLVKRNGQYEFQFVKSCPLFRSLAGLAKDNYFDQVTVTKDGKIVQVKMEGADQGKEDEEGGLAERKDLVFEVYLDEERILERIAEKFPKTLSQRSSQPEKSFGYSFVDDYLFIKLGSTIEYLKIFNQAIDSNRQQAKVLNLSLDPKTKIQRIASTEPYRLSHSDRHIKYYCPEFAQIVLTESKIRAKCNMWVITWDLKKNMEFSSLEVEDIKESKAASYLCKGLCQKLNYIVTESQFFDIQFMAPFSYVTAGKRENVKNIRVRVNEVKVSDDKAMYLGLGRLSCICKSYSLQSLIYWREIFALKFVQPLPPSRLHPEHLSLVMRRNNVFHMVALDFSFLKQVLEEIKKAEPSEEEHDKSNPYRQLIFHLVYPNHREESPFDIAINNNSPKCIDIMLQMLVEVPEFRVSHFLKHHFSTLFSMNLESFETFLDSCLFTNLPMKQIKAIKWEHSTSEIYLDYHTSFIASQFQKRILPKGKDSAEEEEDEHAAKAEKKVNASELSRYDPQIFDEGLEENFSNQKKRVEVSAVEFDWIFEGRDAKNFINRLAETENENLFTIPTVKAIILFLWQKYFYRILAVLFIPYVVYIMIFNVYIMVVYEQKIQQKKEDMDGVERSYDIDFEKVDRWFVAISFIFLIYFFCMQFYQFWHKKLDYFKNMWNLLDLISIILNVTMMTLDLKDFTASKVRPVGAVAVFFMFIKVFFYLRLFSSTSHMIRLVIECCIDMGGFAFILFLGMTAWACSFYILNINAYERSEFIVNNPEMFEDEIDNIDEIEPFYFTEGSNLLLSFIYSFRMGLGDFNLDYRGLQAEALLWLMFLLEAAFIQILMLNLLISIMGDTFGRVSAIMEQNKLKEICQMIIEHDFLLSRAREYKTSKYIFLVKLEQAGGAGGGLNDGPIAQLAQTVHSMLSEQRKETEAALDAMKDELIAGQKGIDKKLSSVGGGGGGSNPQQLQQLIADMAQVKEAVQKNANQVDDMLNSNNERFKALEQLILQLSQQVGQVGQNVVNLGDGSGVPRAQGKVHVQSLKKIKVKARKVDDDDDEEEEDEEDEEDEERKEGSEDESDSEQERRVRPNLLVPKTRYMKGVE